MQITARELILVYVLLFHLFLTSLNRLEVKNLGGGRHQLVLHKIKMCDHGTIEAKTPSNYGNEMLTTQCDFGVAKGETAPEIGNTGPVTGIANKDCNWDVPYSVSIFNK